MITLERLNHSEDTEDIEAGHGDIIWETNDNGIKKFLLKKVLELQWCWSYSTPAVLGILRD